MHQWDHEYGGVREAKELEIIDRLNERHGLRLYVVTLLLHRLVRLQART